MDMEGNDLLNPSFECNIVSQTPTMINIWGNEVKCPIFRWEAVTSDGIVLDNSYYIQPGFYSISSSTDGWFNNEKIILKWGGDIENDTIVFSGGWKEDWGPGVSNITINGEGLEQSKNTAVHGDYHFIYRKKK